MDIPYGDTSGFIVDEMLQKLGRFLRIAGFNVLIPRGVQDREMAEMAEKEGMVLLTRDKDLSNMKGLHSIRIISDDVSIQLQELKGRGALKEIMRSSSRCPACNTILSFLSKENILTGDVDLKVPPKVLDHQTSFYLCRGCNKIYWQGRQWEDIAVTLKDIGLLPELPADPNLI
jgi:hypothetical protein